MCCGPCQQMACLSRVPSDSSRSAGFGTAVCRSAALSVSILHMMVPLGVEARMSTPSASQRFSSLPDPITCPSSRSLLSTQPMDSPHNLRLHDINDFLSVRNRNRNQTHTLLSKNNSRSQSTHGLHMPPHLDSRHHRFLEMVILFPRLPPPPENCSSLEVMYPAPSLQAMIYI